MKNGKWKMSVRIGIFLLTFFLIVSNTNYALIGQAEEMGSLYALSAVLMDADTGRILYGKDADVARANASTTKILTCIIALENSTRDDVVLVSEHASHQPKVHAGLRENELYFMEDLLYSLMLESHNDSAVAIAEHVAGSVEAFAQMMNEKAREIGCTTANFVTPNGLDGSNDLGKHGISAVDLARIMRYCISQSPKADSFIKITQTRNYTFQEITRKQTISCVNKNSFLDMVDGVISGKTGFTGEAGYCYVTAVEQDGKTFIIALLGCGWPNNKGYKWTDTRKLMEYGIENYEYGNIREEVVSEKILLLNGVDISEPFKKTIYVRTSVQNDSGNMQILLRQDEVIVVKTVQLRTIWAPAKKNQKVGKIFYMLEDEVITSFDIVLEETIKRRTYILDLNILIREILL